MSGYFGGGGGGAAGLWEAADGTTLQPIAPYVNITMTGTATFGGTVSATGQFLAATAAATAPSYAFTAAPSTGMFLRADGIGLSITGTEKVEIILNVFRFHKNMEFGWTDNLSAAAAADLTLARDAADTLAQRRTTNAQTFRIYGTYTDASNYERLAISCAASMATIEHEEDGTGSLASLTIRASANNVYLGTNKANGLWLYTNSRFQPISNGSVQLGNTTNRFNKAFLGGSTVTADWPAIDIAQTWNNAAVTFNGILMDITNTASAAASMLMDLKVGSASKFQVTKGGGCRVSGSEGYGFLGIYDVFGAGGNWLYINAQSSPFGIGFRIGGSLAVGVIGASAAASMLAFQGTTSSYPALKRSTTSLEVKLADDSAYANIYALAFKGSGDGTSTLPVLTGTVSNTGIYFATDTWKLRGVVAGTDIFAAAADRFVLAPAVMIRWSTTAIAGTEDLGLARASANLLRVTSGSTTTIGKIEFARNVQAQTGSDTISLLESNKVFTNEGATASVPLTLPTAVAGLVYTFVVQDADGIEIKANVGDTIRFGTEVSASAGNVISTLIGSSITLLAINATEWVAISAIGIWTVT